MRQTILTAAILLGSGLALSSSAFAQCGAIKLTATTPASSQRIGESMAWVLDNASGNQRLIVGAPKADNGAALNAGIVKYFGRVGTQWGELAELRRPGAAANSEAFGASVAANGTQIIVGAPGVQSNRGSAFIYEFQGSWVNVATIGSTQVAQRVGAAVAMDGDYAFIGSPDFDTTNNAGSGLVMVYKRATNGTWSQTQTISDTAATSLYVNRALGSSVAAASNILVIGAPYANIPGSPLQSGMVRIMRRNLSGTYVAEAAEFVPTNVKTTSGFGSAVAVDGVRIAVGAPTYSATSATDGFDVSQCGAVWIITFRPGGWAVEDMILPTTPVVQGSFGASVAISGDRLLVGQPGNKTVAAYRRQTSGQWALERTYSDEDTAANGSFGSAVAIGSGNHFIADALDDLTTASDAGAIYIKPFATAYADSCEAAYTMTSSTLTGCTLEATPDTVPTCGPLAGTANGKGVWISYVPATTGAATLTTSGSGFDTVLSVHTACPTAASPALITCNDDAGDGSFSSRVTFDVVAGQSYLVNLRGYGAAAGSFILNASVIATCPADWNHSGSVTVQDIFDFLSSWFAGNGDFNNAGGTTVQDIFDFLSAWFTGCP